MTTMPSPTTRTMPLWLMVAIAIALAALVGWIDYHSEEVQGPALLLIIFSGALAFADPGRAWLVVLVLGLSIAGTHAVASAIGLHPAYPMDSPVSSLLALIPAAIGAGCGVGARLVLRESRARQAR